MWKSFQSMPVPYPGVPLPASSLVSVAGGPAGFQCSGLIDDAGSGVFVFN